MFNLNNYLPPILHPGFSRNNGVVVYVHESISYEVVRTEANLCHGIFETTNKNKQCFVVVCMYVSPFFKQSLKLKDVDFLLKAHSNLMGSPVFTVGDMNIDLLKQNNLSCTYSNLLQYNGLRYLLTTATRITIGSATLIDHVFHNQFFDKPDCGILDAGLTDHRATFVSLPFSL